MNRTIRRTLAGLAITGAVVGTGAGVYALSMDHARVAEATVADLRAQLAATEDSLAAQIDWSAETHQEPIMYEDGSWTWGDVSGCAPTALCDDAYWATQE